MEVGREDDNECRPHALIPAFIWTTYGWEHLPEIEQAAWEKKCAAWKRASDFGLGGQYQQWLLFKFRDEACVSVREWSGIDSSDDSSFKDDFERWSGVAYDYGMPISPEHREDGSVLIKPTEPPPPVAPGDMDISRCSVAVGCLLPFVEIEKIGEKVDFWCAARIGMALFEVCLSFLLGVSRVVLPHSNMIVSMVECEGTSSSIVLSKPLPLLLSHSQAPYMPADAPENIFAPDAQIRYQSKHGYRCKPVGQPDSPDHCSLIRRLREGLHMDEEQEENIGFSVHKREQVEKLMPGISVMLSVNPHLRQFPVSFAQPKELIFHHELN